jgi:16S rRNA (guanine527-N7)-methyltransferase
VQRARRARYVPEAGTAPEEIVADAASLGVAREHHQAEALLQFGDLLLRWNRAFNLISRRDTDRLVPRHLLDSLSIAPWLIGSTVMDLGTGPGLPGVPLAIVREALTFTLVDRSARKIRFIDQAVRTLGLANVSTWCGDVRDLPQEAIFHTVVCRAVAPLPEIWKLAGERVWPGGRVLIMHRGQTREPAASQVAEQPATALAGVGGHERVLLQVPGLEHPHELVVLDRGRTT